jgi:hypothetical protein
VDGRDGFRENWKDRHIPHPRRIERWSGPKGHGNGGRSSQKGPGCEAILVRLHEGKKFSGLWDGCDGERGAREGGEGHHFPEQPLRTALRSEVSSFLAWNEGEHLQVQSSFRGHSSLELDLERFVRVWS